MRRYKASRAAAAAGEPVAAVRAPRTNERSEHSAAAARPGKVGRVESAVLQEIGELTTERPALVGIALALARDMDNVSFTASHPAMARELAKVLEGLHQAGVRRGRLASVTQLARR